MKAAKEVRDGLGDQARAGVYGHVPGVAVGDVFDGRGALAVLGLHAQVGFSIAGFQDCHPAILAVAMAGRLALLAEFIAFSSVQCGCGLDVILLGATSM